MAMPDTQLRSSGLVLRSDHGRRYILLIRRKLGEQVVHVLPGGTPREGETLAACARREVLEETGLIVTPNRCAFLLETIDPAGARTVDAVFLVAGETGDAPTQLEPELQPLFVALTDLGELGMLPPIAGYLRGLGHRMRPPSIPFLGNLWRPQDPEPDVSDA
ncbi:MAG: NUDIX hydrolase [Nocardioidaceae bacterium]